MPYDPEHPPSKIVGLSKKNQAIWIKVFNQCWEKHHSEEICHKQAWSVTGGWKDKSLDEMLLEIALSDEFGFDVELKVEEIE